MCSAIKQQAQAADDQAAAPDDQSVGNPVDTTFDPFEQEIDSPIVPQRSARCLSVIVRLSKSTALHGRPRSSLARIPVKTAVTKNGRQRPRAHARNRLTSAFAGTSSPTVSLPYSRFLTSTVAGNAAFCTTRRSRNATIITRGKSH